MGAQASFTPTWILIPASRFPLQSHLYTARVDPLPPCSESPPVQVAPQSHLFNLASETLCGLVPVLALTTPLCTENLLSEGTFRGPQPLVFACLFPQQGTLPSLLCWHAATFPTCGQISRKPFLSSTGWVRASPLPQGLSLCSLSVHPQSQCQSLAHKCPLGFHGSQRVKEA